MQDIKKVTRTQVLEYVTKIPKHFQLSSYTAIINGNCFFNRDCDSSITTLL